MEEQVVLQGLWLLLAGGLIAVLVTALAAFIKPLKELLIKRLEALDDSLAILKFESFRQMYDGFKQELVEVVEETVLALNQLYVHDWKAAAKDGKLTQEEVSFLRAELVSRVKSSLSHNAREFFEQHVPSLDAIIQELAEAILERMKTQGKLGNSPA